MARLLIVQTPNPRLGADFVWCSVGLGTTVKAACSGAQETISFDHDISTGAETRVTCVCWFTLMRTSSCGGLESSKNPATSCVSSLKEISDKSWAVERIRAKYKPIPQYG